MTDFDARGLLAARLTCWHRLSGPESDQLVDLFIETAGRHQAAQAKTYQQNNPLGGPAKVFDAMAACVKAGDSFDSVLAAFGFAVVATDHSEQPLNMERKL